MTSNYGENQSDTQSPPEPSLPQWNTWTNRSILKGISGVLFALSIFPLFWNWANASAYPTLGTLFVAGVAVWIIYYQLEMEYRKAIPDRDRIR